MWELIGIVNNNELGSKAESAEHTVPALKDGMAERVKLVIHGRQRCRLYVGVNSCSVFSLNR